MPDISTHLPHGSATAPPTAGPPAVKVIKPSEFGDAISAGDVVVEFFSYGCGYCKRARPEVYEAAKKMADTTFVMLSVMNNDGAVIGASYGAGALPSFAAFRDGAYLGSFTREGALDVTSEAIVSKAKALLG